MPVTKQNDKVSDVCFQLEPYDMHRAATNLDPEGIMFSPTALASQLRLIMYGSRAYPEQKPDNKHLAPNIAHYAWLGGNKMPYTFFLSVLSAIFLGKVDKVYIHGETHPTGELWTKLLNMDTENRVQHVLWNRTVLIYQQKVEQTANQADLIKASVMWLQGGIIMDPDLVFVRPPDPEHFHYEALVTLGGGPRMLNPSVAISKPKSEYSHLWLESLREFENDHYVWNCCKNMYRIWERKPTIAKAVRNFNLICRFGKCYPTWLDSDAMKKPEIDWMKNVTNWKKQIVTVHFQTPDPFKSFMQCAYELKGLSGEVARMILRAAGLLAHGEGLVP